jgi:hypothetical protein
MTGERGEPFYRHVQSLAAAAKFVLPHRTTRREEAMRRGATEIRATQGRSMLATHLQGRAPRISMPKQAN